MQACSIYTSKMRILCIITHLTIDPCSNPLYYKMIVFIVSLCMTLLCANMWLVCISLDILIKTNFVICETPHQDGDERL